MLFYLLYRLVYWKSMQTYFNPIRTISTLIEWILVKISDTCIPPFYFPFKNWINRYLDHLNTFVSN
jgi:hypothetical protein